MPAGKQVMDLVHLLSPYFVRSASSIGTVAHNLFSAAHPDVDAADIPAGGEVLTYDGGTGKWMASPPAAGGHDIEVDTVDQNDRANLNFADGDGIDMSGTDDPVNDRTTITADLDVPGLPVMADADLAADYLLAYDSSAGAHERLLIANLPWPTSGGASALGIR